MASDAAKLAEAAVVRMCHDLAGPASALVNGADLLQAEGGGGFAAEALGLLRASARALAARLELFRAVFGAPTAHAVKSAAAARAVAAAYFAQLGDRARVFTLAAFPEEEADPETLRRALLLALIGADALPFGGEVAVTAEAGGLRLRAAGRRAGFSAAAEAGLAAAETADPRAAAAALLAARAAAAGCAARPWQEADVCGLDILPGGVGKL
ncbi:histidine phosphotransferase family protein [Oleispirillum naphthae]|uniref:histidine phosphotransferase family protein n=1 Tax=Oleispirillum naphthae TaxID=2838853 RepID=UPI0030823E96